jgi:ABC-type Na+ efflux pump permease subunit
MTERVAFSAGRVWVIACNTYTEAVRQKVYNILLIFALVIISTALFFRQFTFASEQLKFVQDFCLGALSVFGTLIAIVGTAQLLPGEVENRTIYTILSKPVRRFEFLLGKYAGSVLLVLTSAVMMSLMFAAVLWMMQQRLVADVIEHGPPAEGVTVQEAIAQIRAQAFNPDVGKGIVLIVVKLWLLAAITLLFSTFSTSMVFNVVAAAMVFFAGHLRAGAMDVWGEHRLLMYALAILPDLGAFNVADEIVIGHAIPTRHVLEVAGYGLLRTAVIVVASHLIFSRREI